jgi:uncharacterized protein YkwD
VTQPSYSRPGKALPQTTPTRPSLPQAAQSFGCMTAEENRLVNAINSYRRSKGLPAVAATVSLTTVARTHAADLAIRRPANGRCNMHSWSSGGKWTGCCYTSDHRQAACMWKKPRELTQYQGDGFEVSAGSSGSTITAESALSLWQRSSGHNQVIINAGMWKRPWRAFGVGIYGGYAVAWFGNAVDPAGAATLCK